jgi:hypothetical protein
MSTTTVTTDILSVEDVATILSVPSLAVQRLIAKEALKATELQPGTFRILAGDLSNYVRAGAKGLTLPAFSGVWFDARETRLADAFQTAVINANNASWPTIQELQAIFDKSPQSEFTGTLDVGPLASLIKSTPPRSILPGSLASPFENYGALYLAGAWRSEAKQILSASPVKMIPTLYSTPQNYVATTMLAWSRVIAGFLQASKPYTVTWQGSSKPVRLTLTLSNADIAKYVDKDQLELATF